MRDLRVPTTVKELMQVLGFFGYYRNFIRCFAHIAAPLTDLLQDNRKGVSNHDRVSRSLVWEEKHQKAFDLLKARLADAVTLAHPEDKGFVEYRLYVDGCKLGIGAALHIVCDIEKEISERPVSFISRGLRKAEKNYWPTELEMLALTWSLKRFEEIIEGQPLTIYTDHSALKWLFQATNNKTGHNQRLFLWALQLEKWKNNTKIIHRPGRAHLNADVLSRFPIDLDTPDELRKTLEVTDSPATEDSCIATVSMIGISDNFKALLIQGYSADAHWKSIYDKLVRDSEQSGQSVEYHNFRYDASTQLLSYIDPETKAMKLCIPKNCLSKILESSHDQSGHLGFNKVYEKLRDSYHIEKLSKILRSYIRACPTCATLRNKDHRNDMLHPLELPLKPCDCIALDFVTSLPPDGDFDSFISITDKFSKYVTIIPNRGVDTASQVADRFFQSYYPRFGLPLRMISDRDPKFISKFWQTLFKRLQVDLLLSSAYAPQTDGQSERSNQTIENMLRAYIGYDLNRKWVDDLKEIEFTINSHPSEATGISPFQCLYGFEPRQGWTIPSNDVDSEIQIDLQEHREQVRKDALAHLAYSRANMARKYDSTRHERDLKVGDNVYVENRSGLRIPGIKSTKTGPKRFGPFAIKELIGLGAVRLILPPTYRMHDVVSRRHVTLAHEDPWDRIPSRPPAIVAEDGEEEYEVEAVLDERQYRKRTQYLVKWLGYPIHESTWVDEDQAATFPDALVKYKEKKKSRS